MGTVKRTRLTLRGTDISYDVLPGRIEPVEVFKGGVAISRLSPVDAHLVTISLLTKLREQWARQGELRQKGSALDKAGAAMDSAFEEMDRAFDHIDAATKSGGALARFKDWTKRR